MKKYIEFLLQVTIIVSCFVVLANQWTAVPSSAQAPCNNQPLIRDVNYPDAPWHNLKANTWLPGVSAINKRQIALVIHDTPSDIKAKMEDGIRTWNNWSDCAFVNFNAATTGTNPPGVPPSNTLWVTRGINTQGFPTTDNTNQMISFNIRVWTQWTPSSAETWEGLLRHEAGHSFGLLNSAVGANTIMSNYSAITSCDTEAIRKIYCPTPTPTPTPTPYPTPYRSGGCDNAYENFQQGACPLYFSSDDTGYWCCEDGCNYQSEEQVYDPSGYGELDCWVCQDGIDNDCDGGIDDLDWDCDECWPSPIVIDTLGNGFDLTGVSDGVNFDIRGVGRPIRVAWIQGDDAWLALDRNGNGTIDNGKELFGNFTYQLQSAERNGFRGLNVYDETGNGGNADGRITDQDSIYPTLRLWFDSNKNGVSEPSELYGLASKNVAEIELDYRTSNKTDTHGNRFRYRAKIKSSNGQQLGRWAWDVFLSNEPLTASVPNIFLREALASKFALAGKSSCKKKLTQAQHLVPQIYNKLGT